MKKEKSSVFILFLIVLIITSEIISIIILNKKILDLENKLENENRKLETRINEKIDTNNIELQNKIKELSENLANTKSNVEKEISTIKAKTSNDFSVIIDKSIKSIVNIRTDVAQGTGFIISPDGYIVTNAHVLSGAREAEAITSDYEIKELSLIGYNLTLDLALLKISGNHDYLELENSDNVRVGEKVIAIGNPLGLSFSVSEGIVSGIHRLGMNGIPAYIQTDASLNPGNSGGPLINTNGKVIGINNFKARAENIGFALESNYIKEGIKQIINEKKLNITI